MILIGYFLWLLLATWVAFKIFRRLTCAFGARVMVGVIGGVMLALLPYWDVILGLPETTRACRDRAGLQLEKDISLPINSVHVALKFSPLSACSTCLEILASGGATETQVIIAPLSAASTRPGQVAMGTMVEDPGPTRYWISKRGDPHCYSFYLQFAPSLQDRREFWERNGAAFDDEACIAAESIPSITSEFETVLDDTTAQHGIATLRIREVTLTNLHRQERIASLASVTQIPWTAKVFLYGLPPVPQCPSPSSSEQPGNNFDAADLFARLRATARQEQ